MGKPKAKALEMKERHKKELTRIVSKHKSGQQLVKRSRILLMAGAGISNSQIQRELQMSYHTILSWRKRWVSNYDSLLIFESGESGQGMRDSQLHDRILEILKDKPRSGAPKVFTLAQRKQLVALACKKPEDYGIEMTDWTYDMLAKTAIAQGIVERISGAWLGTILKKYGTRTA